MYFKKNTVDRIELAAKRSLYSTLFEWSHSLFCSLCQSISPCFPPLIRANTFRTWMTHKLHKSTTCIIKKCLVSSQSAYHIYTSCAYVKPIMPIGTASTTASKILISRSKNSGTSGSSGTLISGHLNGAVQKHSINVKGVLMTLKYRRFLWYLISFGDFY